MKLLLYCTKAKPYLIKMPGDEEEFKNGIEFSITSGEEFKQACIDVNKFKLNGKIVAECDFEVEEVYSVKYSPYIPDEFVYKTTLLKSYELEEKSCLTQDQLFEYLTDDCTRYIDDGYAIHIKNLHIFDKPKELSEYLQSNLPNPKHIKFANWEANYYWALGDYTTNHSQMTCKQLVETFNNSISIKKAPQNMCYCYEEKEKKVLISIKPEWLCKILNGEKTIEVRKKVLKEMLLWD